MPALPSVLARFYPLNGFRGIQLATSESMRPWPPLLGDEPARSVRTNTPPAPVPAGPSQPVSTPSTICSATGSITGRSLFHGETWRTSAESWNALRF